MQRHRSVEYSLSASTRLLGARRDKREGVDTSSGLLLSVMGEFVLPNEGVAWTQTIIELLEVLDVREAAARQALARTAERGWLERERVGRQTRWAVTDLGRSLLEPGAERIYRFGQRARSWDGTWLVLLASVPEAERSVRYRMSVGLRWAGFGSIGQGIWLCPWVEQELGAVQLLEQLGVDATSFVSRLGAMGSATELAGAAWDLAELRTMYAEFLADTERMPTTRDGKVAAGELAALVHSWRRFPFLDPDLPDELLPSDWPQRSAAQRFAKLRAALSPRAHQWWRRSEAELDPTALTG